MRADKAKTRVQLILDVLKYSPPARNRTSAKRSKRRFLAEAQQLAKSEQSGSLVFRLGWLPRWLAVRGASLRPAAAALVLVLGVFVTGGGATVFAAERALPGDWLYPLHTELETISLTFSKTAQGDMELHLANAEQRLQDLESLVSLGRYDDATFAVEEYNRHIVSARSAYTSTVQSVSSEYEEALIFHQKTIEQILATAPEDFHTTLRNVIERSSSASVELTIIGVVEGSTAEHLLVDGMEITITHNTEISAPLHVGNTVKVLLLINEGGSNEALAVELIDTTDTSNSNDSPESGEESEQSVIEDNTNSVDGNGGEDTSEDENENTESHDEEADTNEEDNANNTNDEEDDGIHLDGNENGNEEEENGGTSDDGSSESSDDNNDSSEDDPDDEDNSGSGGSGGDDSDDNSASDDDDDDDDDD